MDDARDLAGLRDFVTMLGDEHLLEGWAALAGQSGSPVLGLVLLTDQRVIFIDVQAGLTAFPVSKISHFEVAGPCAVTFTVWYGTMALTFDSPGIRGAMLNLLRQDPAWTAHEAPPGRSPDRAVAVGFAPVALPHAQDREARRGANPRGAVIAPLEAA